MKNNLLVFIVLSLSFTLPFNLIGQDTVEFYNYGHASVMLKYNKLVIQIDPVMREADYSTLPDADIIIITHQHSDHFDLTAINHIKKENSILIYTQTCASQINYPDSAIIMANGDSVNVHNIPVVAVPAYNPVKTQHPKGIGNGYVITLGGQKVYIAGDTEDIPEMANLGKIDIAFMPMNQPYTMTGEQAANAALMIKPRILNIYHYQQIYVNTVLDLLKNQTGMEIRIDNVVVKPFGTNKEENPNEPDDTSNTTLFNSKHLHDISFYPNPAFNTIYFNKSIDSVIQIYDLTGKAILQLGKKNTNTIDLSGLPAGIYILKIQTGSNPILKKIVKN